MYVYAVDHEIIKYPYSILNLRQDHWQTSFPVTFSKSLLSEFNVYLVSPTKPPTFNHKTQRLVEKSPELKNGDWLQVWEVKNATEDEIAFSNNEIKTGVRMKRDALLAQSDWTQFLDSPLSNTQKEKWKTYRQQLRDVSAQAGFPWEIEWPTQPE